MIVNTTKQSDMSTIGDMRQIEATVDVKNLAFMATLLSSNLYSKPEESFLREIVSNAWDAHVEAGNTNKPVIIKIKGNDVTIRDYGTGLSQEDFEDLYCKIGSSTKRDSNAYIGKFGLGHLSPLAVSNIVNISDYYNGKVYNYIMVKDCGNIVTTFVGEYDTTEDNGLSISVNVPHIIHIKEAIKYLTFFSNVFVSCENSEVYWCKSFNEANIKRYKTFSVSSVFNKISGIKILFGNVLYPLEENISNEWTDDKDLLKALSRNNICIHVPIGEIDVTPNRESIIYSEATIKAIRDRFNACVEEINELSAKALPDNTDDIAEYFRIIRYSQYYYPISNKIGTSYEYGYAGIECKPSLKYKGVKRSEYFNKLLYNIGDSHYEVKAFFSERGSVKVTKVDYYSVTSNARVLDSNKKVAFENNRPLGMWQKSYLKDTCHYTGCVVYYPTLKGFRELFRAIHWDILSRAADSENRSKYEDALLITEDMYNWGKKYIKVITDAEVIKYKEEVKASNLTDNSYYRDPNVYNVYKVLNYTSQQLAAKDKTFAEIIESFKANKSKTFIIHKGRDFSSYERPNYEICIQLGYTVLWVTEKLYNKLAKFTKTNPIPNVFLDTQSVLNENNKKFQKIIALKDVILESPNEDGIYIWAMIKKLSEHCNGMQKIELNELISLAKDLTNLSDTSKLINEQFKDAKVVHPQAIRVKQLVDKYKNLATMLLMFKDRVNEYFHSRNEALAKYLYYRWCLKNKIRFNYGEYKRLKNEPLIKLIYEQVITSC